MYIDKNGVIHKDDSSQDRLLKTVYSNVVLRILMKPLTLPIVSAVAGKALDSGLSRAFIKPFIKANKIDMRDFEKREFKSFNDFFKRRVKDGARPVSKARVISPSDGRVSVYDINNDSVFKVKGSRYSLFSLTRSSFIAKRFCGGKAVIIRLCPQDYHRYCYSISGRKSINIRIPGFLNTVNPAAYDNVKVFCENTREYCLINNCRTCVLQMEVGALMVGRISNNRGISACVKKGVEKGCFEFGGSTIILLLQKGVSVKRSFIENTQLGLETLIKQGEAITED